MVAAMSAPASIAAVLLLATITAQEPASPTQPPEPTEAQKIQSGPPKGRRLTELRIVDVVGERAGVERDVAPELQSGPVAILFVHEVTRNVAPVVRGFDVAAADLAAYGLRTLCIRLDADRTKAEQHTSAVVNALRMRRPMVVGADGAEGPGNYALHRKATLTLVRARDGVVVDSVAFTDTGAQDIGFVEMLLCQLVGAAPTKDGELRETLEWTLPQERAALLDVIATLEKDRRALAARVAELERQLAQTRGNPAPMRQDAARMNERPAADVGQDLAGILRRLARADVAEAEVTAALAQLDTRLKAQPDLRPQARTILQRVVREGAAPEVARTKVAEWLARTGDR